MRVDILTLFPEMFGYLQESILKRAQENGRLSIHLHNIREHGVGKHRITDEPPYGGGGGMVLKPDPIFSAIENIPREGAAPIILLTPQGRPFTQDVAQDLSEHDHHLPISLPRLS